MLKYLKFPKHAKISGLSSNHALLMTLSSLMINLDTFAEPASSGALFLGKLVMVTVIPTAKWCSPSLSEMLFHGHLSQFQEILE